jgi:hypothetical protein
MPACILVLLWPNNLKVPPSGIQDPYLGNLGPHTWGQASHLSAETSHLGHLRPFGASTTLWDKPPATSQPAPLAGSAEGRDGRSRPKRSAPVGGDSPTTLGGLAATHVKA